MSRIEGAVFKPGRWVAPIAVVLLLGALAAAAMALSKSTTVTTHKTKRGKVLAAASGHSLYLFTADTSAKATCYGSCAKAWKPLLSGTRASAAGGSGVNAKLLGTTRRTDGTLQVTYNRHPLYLFAQDTRAGQITGEGAKAFHGHWYVVSVAGKAVKPKSGGTTCKSLCQGY
jgi:predicted lipoprotein with Yx(FWY)xxD motif